MIWYAINVNSGFDTFVWALNQTSNTIVMNKDTTLNGSYPLVNTDTYPLPTHIEAGEEPPSGFMFEQAI